MISWPQEITSFISAEVWITLDNWIAGYVFVVTQYTPGLPMADPRMWHLGESCWRAMLLKGNMTRSWSYLVPNWLLHIGMLFVVVWNLGRKGVGPIVVGTPGPQNLSSASAWGWLGNHPRTLLIIDSTIVWTRTLDPQTSGFQCLKWNIAELEEFRATAKNTPLLESSMEPPQNWCLSYWHCQFWDSLLHSRELISHFWWLGDVKTSELFLVVMVVPSQIHMEVS